MLVFSRHAKNRMRLFRIREDEVLATWNEPESTSRDGGLVRCVRHFPRRFHGRPLLVVVDPNTLPPTVVTAYLAKRSRRGR